MNIYIYILAERTKKIHDTIYTYKQKALYSPCSSRRPTTKYHPTPRPASPPQQHIQHRIAHKYLRLRPQQLIPPLVVLWCVPIPISPSHRFYNRQYKTRHTRHTRYPTTPPHITPPRFPPYTHTHTARPSRSRDRRPRRRRRPSSSSRAPSDTRAIAYPLGHSRSTRPVHHCPPAE